MHTVLSFLNDECDFPPFSFSPLQVVSACGRLIGFLSRSRLESIVARFLRELATPSESGQPARLRSDSSVARQELFQLCEGMKFVELPASNSAEVG